MGFVGSSVLFASLIAVSPYPAREKLLDDANHLEKVWKHHILELQKDPERGILIVPPVFEDDFNNPLPRAYCRRLIEFAKNHLKERAVVVTDEHSLEHSKLVRFLRVNRKKKGLAMGEYYDLCVRAEAGWFTQITGQKVRRSIARSNRSSYLKPFNPNDRLSDHYTRVAERAKRSFGKPK